MNLALTAKHVSMEDIQKELVLTANASVLMASVGIIVRHQAHVRQDQMELNAGIRGHLWEDLVIVLVCVREDTLVIIVRSQMIVDMDRICCHV